MLSFALKRLLQGIMALFVIFTLTFFMLRFAPGSPYAQERNMPPHIEEYRKASLGLDQPLYKQYFKRLGAVMRGDFDLSDKYQGRRVAEIIRDAFPVSLQVGVVALGIALCLGIPAGVFSARHVGQWQDQWTMVLVMLGMCLPSFVLGPLLVLQLALKWNWFNASGWFDFSDLFLPALTLGIIHAAYLARLMRSGMKDALQQDYVRTARAKGLGETLVVWKHAMKNAMLPVLSFLGPALAGLITGSFVIESVFQLPGLGQHFINAAVNRDVSLCLGVVVFYGVFIVLFNFLVDVAQIFLNPRLSFHS